MILCLLASLTQVTEREIDHARTGYQPCGDYNSILFFCIGDLAAIDPMYQYSLPWFINLFVASVQAAAAGSTLTKRLENIYDHFTYSLYCNVCRQVWASPGASRPLLLPPLLSLPQVCPSLSHSLSSLPQVVV